MPAQNVQYAALAAFVVVLLTHILGAYNITMSTDISTSLTGLITVLVAHGVDVLTGQNKPPAK